MSTDPRFEHIRSLLSSKHFAEALAGIRQVEASGAASPELAFAKGLCFAGLGRVSEARAIARHLKEEGHVALSQRLAQHITVEEPPQGLIQDEPSASVAPPYPAPAKQSNAKLISGIAAGAVVLVVVGIAVGVQLAQRAPKVAPEPSTDSNSPAAVKQDVAQPPKQQLATKKEEAPVNLTGHWRSVDFVADVSQFKPGESRPHRDFYLKELSCFPDGSATLPIHWQKGYIVDDKSQYRAEYTVKVVDGATYLFLPWISGDVTVGGQKPQYYVLQKTGQPIGQSSTAASAAQQQPTAQQKAIQWERGSLDITGSWSSVDYVDDPSQFKPGKRAWRGDLFLKSLQCYEDGSTSTQVTWGGGWIRDPSTNYRIQYDVWIANGQTFLFFPWLNGDVTAGRQTPQYYVLQRV